MLSYQIRCPYCTLCYRHISTSSSSSYLLTSLPLSYVISMSITDRRECPPTPTYPHLSSGIASLHMRWWIATVSISSPHRNEVALDLSPYDTIIHHDQIIVNQSFGYHVIHIITSSNVQSSSLQSSILGLNLRFQRLRQLSIAFE